MHSTSHARSILILQLIVAATVLHARATLAEAQADSDATSKRVATASEPAVTAPEPAATAPEPVATAPEPAEAVPGQSVEARPWARGVSQERQNRALELYAAGTKALTDLQFSTAVARYREALKHWDHPSIHYHLAIAYMNLEQPLEAYHGVLAALRYGGAALDTAQRMQALGHKAALLQRVGTFDVSNTVPGSSVFIDGERLLDSVGQDERVMLAGEHQVMVRKPGFVAWSESLRLEPGTRVWIEVEGRREIVSPWVPWAIVGAGVAVGGLGAALHWRAHKDMARFDDKVAELCAPDPCQGDENDTPVWLMDRAYREQQAAVAAYVLGAGAVVGGLVLAWINPGRSFRLEQRRGPSQPLLVPHASPTSVGMSFQRTF